MSWVAVSLAGVGAGASYLNNKAKQKQESANMMANAEAMRYSPWTGMKPQMMGRSTGSDTASIMQGGLQGAMFGSQFHGRPAPTPNSDAVTADLASQQKLAQVPVGSSAVTPQPPGLGGQQLAENLQSPNMPTPGELGWQQPGQNLWSHLKKPNMYGSNY